MTADTSQSLLMSANSHLTRGSFLRLAGTFLVGAGLAPVLTACAGSVTDSDLQNKVPTGSAEMTKKKYTMAVFTNAVEGREEEFNNWYSKQHVYDVIKIPGFVAAQRFKLGEYNRPAPAKFKYYAIYDLETDNLDAAIAELFRRNGTPDMVASTAMDPDVYFEVWEELTPKVTK